MSLPRYPRRLQSALVSALGDTPVVCLAGARRTGRTTLVEALRSGLPEAACHTFADPATMAAATRDPAAFLEGLPAMAILEDAERAPGILPLLRNAVGGGRRFLLTTTRGLPGLTESLTGSLETFTLWPLAQAEREGIVPGLIDACFQGDPSRLDLLPQTRQDLLGRLLAGGYPEAVDLDPSPRERWFHTYLASLVQGRLGVLTGLREAHQLIRLLASPGADPGLAGRCRDLLEDAHVMAPLAAGAGDRARWFNDSALQAHVLGLAPTALEFRPMLASPLLETFAFMELVKTAPWSRSRPALSRFRAGAQDLVVLEDRRGQLAAFTVCAAATVQAEACRGLQALRERVGDRLRTGIVLHAGGECRAVVPGFWTLPFQALWAAGV